MEKHTNPILLTVLGKIYAFNSPNHISENVYSTHFRKHSLNERSWWKGNKKKHSWEWGSLRLKRFCHWTIFSVSVACSELSILLFKEWLAQKVCCILSSSPLFLQAKHNYQILKRPFEVLSKRPTIALNGLKGQWQSLEEQPLSLLTINCKRRPWFKQLSDVSTDV